MTKAHLLPTALTPRRNSDSHQANHPLVSSIGWKEGIKRRSCREEKDTRVWRDAQKTFRSGEKSGPLHLEKKQRQRYIPLRGANDTGGGGKEEKKEKNRERERAEKYENSRKIIFLDGFQTNSKVDLRRSVRLSVCR